MKLTAAELSLLALTALPCTANAQSYLYMPATQGTAAVELAGYALHPFMQTDCRLQMFFSAAEAGASNFTTNGISMRYDGPIPQVGAPGPFSIQRLRIRVGTTSVNTPGASFAANLTQPLSEVFDGPWSYLPDPGSAFPHPWGAPAGAMEFAFSQPEAISIPNGGWFVVEMVMEGNNIANFGFSHAILDGISTTGGPTDGSSTPFGQGCSIAAGQAQATMATTGIHAPGAAFFLTGANLGSNVFAAGLIGLSNTSSTFGPLPLNVPGTGCDLLVSGELVTLLQTSAAGSIQAGPLAGAVVVPADPSFSGMQLYGQLASFVPGANSPWDMVFSNGVDIVLGGFATPGIGVYAISHSADANAAVADTIEPFGYALRVQTQ
jgi:hypothetical protein